jgi:hypothetical protein
MVLWNCAVDAVSVYPAYRKPFDMIFERANRAWWALVDDLRTLPPGQIIAGIPHIGELSLLTSTISG